MGDGQLPGITERVLTKSSRLLAGNTVPARSQSYLCACHNRYFDLNGKKYRRPRRQTLEKIPSECARRSCRNEQGRMMFGMRGET